MSLVLATTLQAGQGATAANNCFLAPDPSVPGQFKLKRGNAGAGIQDLLTIDPLGNVLIDVNPATGNRSKQIATMQKFADEFGGSLGSSGWQKLPTGLIIQWGSSSFTGTSLTITLPVAFVSGLYSCVATDAESDPASIKKISVNTSSTTTITLACDSNAGTFLWMAIGK